MKKGFWIVLGILAVGLTGCGKPQMMVAQPVCIEAISQDKLMEITEKTLVSMQFGIEKLDAESGFVRTRPLRGGQFFEPWRKDNAGGFNAAEANLQSIQRTAELTFAPQQTGICMQCTVTVQRLSLPEEQLRGFNSAAAIYTTGSRSKQALDVEAERGERMQWIELGRDAALEQKILKEIQATIKKGVQ